MAGPRGPRKKKAAPSAADDPRRADREHAEDAPRQSEERLRRLFETMAEGVVLIAADGRIVSANTAVESMLGISRSEIEGRAYDSLRWEMLRPDRTPMPWEETAASRAMKEKRAVRDVVMGAVRPDGAVSWINVNAAPFLDAAGEPEGVVGTFTDITARKQAEDALRESEQRFSLALEGTGAGLWDWDMVKDQVVYSTQWKRMLGYEDEEVEDAFAGWQSLWHPDDRTRIEEALDDYLSGRTSHYEVVHRLRHKDGAWRWIVTRGGIMRGSAGQPLRWVGTNVDITARKQLEAELASSEQNFRAFFEAVDDIIVVATPEGRLVYANPAASTRLGYSAAELAGTQVLDLYPAEKHAAAEAMFAAMLKGERESSAPPLQSKSGVLIPVETRVWLGRWDGAACVFGVSRDLTREQEALQKFESLFRGNPALMALTSQPEGKFTDVNDAYLSALG